MQQELMRAVVLMARAIDVAASPLTDAELDELRFLALILRRASRAQEGMELDVLEARATGKPLPQPEL